jgi:hypothetical protein
VERVAEKEDSSLCQSLITVIWVFVKGHVCQQYSNQTTLDIIYDQLMHEFKQLEEWGHTSINGIIEKFASCLALQFNGEMNAEDQIDDDDPDDTKSVDSQEDTPDPGGDSGSEEPVIGPLEQV